MSATDEFPSDSLSLVLWRLANLVVASRAAGASFLWDRGRSNYTKLLHPVDQRRSLHPQALGRTVPTPDHPVARCQCTKDMIPFYLRETTQGDIGFLGILEGLTLGSWSEQYRLRGERSRAFAKVWNIHRIVQLMIRLV